ncbi:MAG: hypothetical protein IPH45_11260 [Bacteroidales bacterium]|nr:hypothetical protein [Bacteroidales bacterium]
MKGLGGKYVIYGGDINQDGVVNLTDISICDSDANSYVTGYQNSDANGDGIIDAEDLILLDNNAFQSVIAEKP